MQDKLYSGSHNTIEIWEALNRFNLKGKIDHKFGSVHSLAVNSQYIFAGKYLIHNLTNLQLLRVRHMLQARNTVWYQPWFYLYMCYKLRVLRIVGTYNRNIQVYDVQTQMHNQSLSGHFGSVTSLTISPSGRFLFSASSDATIKVKCINKPATLRNLKKNKKKKQKKKRMICETCNSRIPKYLVVNDGVFVKCVNLT